ncbi:hypothetical protein ACHAXN_002000 [Cyclotella atomus]
MEQYDDLSAGPTEDGTLNLNHNTWKVLPPELNDFSMKLLHLEMSNNQLAVVPEAIGNLILLKSLDVSLNRIETIDSAIGRCIRLRKLNVTRNRLESLPDEIGQCILLEEILANENKLISLPESLVCLPAIERVDVRNNELQTIPLKLCRVPTMQELLCDNNPNLRSAPINMRGKSELLICCLEMQQKYKDVIDPKSKQSDDLLEKSNKLQNDIAAAQRKIQQLESEIATLQEERPDDYIYYKGRAMIVDLTYNKREQSKEHLESKYIGNPKVIGISRAYENKEKEMSKGFLVNENKKKRNRFIEEDGYDSDTYSKINEAVEYEISSHDVATKEYWSDSDREILNEAKTNAAKHEKELHGDEKLNRRLDHERNELAKDRTYARMTKEKEARDKLKANLISKVSSVKVNNSVSNSINYSDSSQSYTVNNSNSNNSSGNHCTTTSNTNTGNNYSTNNSTTNIYHFQYAPGMPHVTGSGIPVSYPQQLQISGEWHK